MKFLTREYWPYAAMIVSLLMLAAAHAFEIFGKFYPCPLCLRQREIYWAAFGVGAVGILWQRFWPASRIPFAHNLILGAVFMTGVVIACYQVGVEWGLIPSGCASAGFDASHFDPGALTQPMAVGDCSKPPKLFGVSMAAWNALAYLGLAIASFIAATHVVRRPNREEV